MQLNCPEVTLLSILNYYLEYRVKIAFSSFNIPRGNQNTLSMLSWGSQKDENPPKVRYIQHFHTDVNNAFS